MKFLIALFALFTVALSAPTQAQLKSIVSRFSEAELAELRRRVEGCNANVCFALDGSASISDADFFAQRQFVLDVVSVIAVDNPVELAAVQYGTANSAISPLTVNAAEFIEKVNDEGQLRSGQTFVAAGINYCFSELFGRRRGEANKIVLLGDGRSSIGANAIRRSDLFRRVGGTVCAVGAGFADTDELEGIAGGPERVFAVDNFLDVLELQFILEAVVLDICGVEAEE